VGRKQGASHQKLSLVSCQLGPENLTDHQAAKLKDLLRYNLKSVRAHLLRESVQLFWEYVSSGWAAKYLDSWCTRVLRGRSGPMKKAARSLRSHRELTLTTLAIGKVGTRGDTATGCSPSISTASGPSPPRGIHEAARRPD
jgi:transposase